MMSLFRLSWSVLLGGSLLMMSAVAQAAPTIYVDFVSPNVPRGAVVIPPRNYHECYTVEGGYFNGIWVAEHRVCEYPHNDQVWVEGYWKCIRVSQRHHQTTCKRWTWVPSHWEQESYHHRRHNEVAPPPPPSSQGDGCHGRYSNSNQGYAPPPGAVAPPAQPAAPPPPGRNW